MEFDRKDISMNKLVATSLEGNFHVFDMRTQHPTKGFASVSEKVTMETAWPPPCGPGMGILLQASVTAPSTQAGFCGPELILAK